VRPYVLHWLEGYLREDLADLLAPSWFTCVGFAGLVTLIAMLVVARRRGIDPGTIASAVLWSYVAAVGAGIVVPMVIDGAVHVATTGRFHLRWAGMTSFWGYLGGAAALAVVCKRERLPLARMSDLAVVPLGLALVFARAGCFLAGCDYGKVSALPWAVRFPSGSPAWRDHVHAGLIPADRAVSLPVHPTQLYEAVLGLVIIAIAIAVARRPRKDGQVFLAAAATYAIGRLAIEALRGDAGRGIYAGLSSGQIFSLLVLLAISARFVTIRRRTVTAIAAAALGLVIFDVGEAAAQPAAQLPPLGPQPAPRDPQPAPRDLQPAPRDPQPAPPDGPQASPSDPQASPSDPQASPSDPQASPSDPQGPPAAWPELVRDPPEAPGAAPGLPWRPAFSTGLLAGMATPLNRRADQVPTLAGASLSVGYIPGRFGAWLDLDRYANVDAAHTTLIASVSFTPRVTPRLTIGVRSGIGLTEVNFKDPAFRDVAGKTFRLEAVAEYAYARHWVLWVRPLAIDTLVASELGGPITTYQFRVGAAYRFGFRGRAPAIPPPDLPPPLPPSFPDPDPVPAPPTAVTEAP
jgi:prolipoprotein diacylglyceryltransferase